jgi:hypothetical protein
MFDFILSIYLIYSANALTKSKKDFDRNQDLDHFWTLL